MSWVGLGWFWLDLTWLAKLAEAVSARALRRLPFGTHAFFQVRERDAHLTPVCCEETQHFTPICFVGLVLVVVLLFCFFLLVWFGLATLVDAFPCLGNYGFVCRLKMYRCSAYSSTVGTPI